jgi:ferredoxin
MSTQTDTNLDLLVGPIEAPPCTHSQHDSDPEFHSGEATHYVKFSCPGCGSSSLDPRCVRFVAHLASGGSLRCRGCETICPTEFITILGPISGYLS